MKTINKLLWITASTAAGAALGVLASPEKPKCSGASGATAGFISGLVFTCIYEDRAADSESGIEYYTKSSPLYENSEEVGYA